MLRPGNATANATADLIEVAELARAQLPAEAADQPVLVRAITAGTAGLAWHLHHHQLGFSLGLEMDAHMSARRSWACWRESGSRPLSPMAARGPARRSRS